MTSPTDAAEIPARRHHDRPDLRVVSDRRIDLDAAARAAESLLRALAVDIDDPDLAETPLRMARGLAELLTPREFTATTFPNDEGYDQLVVARRIPFTSLCEHHMLPFTGTATVGYLPDLRILGLSKLARLIELFARRPQRQERMTMQAAHWLDTHLAPKGVGVLLEAEHTCMTLRGAAAHNATTVTSALLGQVRTDDRVRTEFLEVARAH